MSTMIIHPEGWKPAKGYANGVLATGRFLCVGGQIGWTADQGFESHDFIGQMEQALRNILAVVEAAGGAVTVNFTPHLMPMNRGILSTIYVRLAPGADAAPRAPRAPRGAPCGTLGRGVIPSKSWGAGGFP